MVVSTEVIISSTGTRKETKLAAHRCQGMWMFAPSVVRSVHGIPLSMCSGTPQSRFQQLWTKELRPLPGPRLGIEVSAVGRRRKNQSGKGKPSRRLTRRGRFRSVVRLRLARQHLPLKPLLPRHRLSPKPLLPPSWEELSLQVSSHLDRQWICPRYQLPPEHKVLGPWAQ